MADVGQSSGEQLSLIKPECYALYKRRWLMLAIFAVFAMSNYFLWAQYAAIFTAVETYYNISKDTVDMLSIVNLITYVVAILPVMWLTEKTNLKVVLILGALLQCVGSWIRYIGTFTISITLNFIGQIVCAMGQPCCFGMSSQLAGTWFGIGEVSLANGIGFAAVEIGVGLALVICPQVVHDESDIKHEMNTLFLWTAIVVTAILPLTIFVFEAEPPLPPSRPKMNVQKAGKQENYWRSLKVLLLNRSFMLLLAANTFNLGFLSLIVFKLEETITLTLSTNANTIIQYIGLAKICSCVIGPMAAGFWLDKSRRFRRTFIVTIFMTAIAVLSFTISIYLDNSVSAVVSMIIYWFFAACTIIIGFEYAIELTYPEPEIMSSGLLNAAGYAFACVMMLLYFAVLTASNIFVTMGMFCAMLGLGFILTLFIGSDYLRQNADMDNYNEPEIPQHDTEMTKCE